MNPAPITPRRSLTVQPLWIHMFSITYQGAGLEVRVFFAARGREGAANINFRTASSRD